MVFLTWKSRKGIVGAESSSSQVRGQAGEDIAVSFLKQQGCRVIERNIRCKAGEIDLVCLDNDILVFVEVRLRVRQEFGGALESVTRAKQQRIVKAARYWLGGKGRREARRACRFDVVLLNDLGLTGVMWVRGAFEA